VNGQIVPLKDVNDITPELSHQIYDGITYICYHSDCKSIAQLFGKERGEEGRQYFVSTLAEELNLSETSSYAPQISSTLYLSASEEVLPLDIA
jgi:hypothetical protein